MHLSAGKWQLLSYKDICEFLAPLIQAGMKKADVDALATTLLSEMKSIRGKPDTPGSTAHTTKFASEAKPTVSVPSVPQLQKESPSCKEIVPLVLKAPDATATSLLDNLF